MKRIKNSFVTLSFLFSIYILLIMTIIIQFDTVICKCKKGENILEVLTENFVLRKQTAELNSKLTYLLTGKTYIESNQVLLGKNQWLFYKSESDGMPLSDYQGVRRFTEEELKEITDAIVLQRDLFAKRGIRFVVYVIPNKEVVYSNLMPDTIIRYSEESRVDLLINYMRENSDLEIVYSKLSFLEEVKNYQLYYKYDTHWNALGAFVGVQDLLYQLYGKRDSLTTKSPIVVSKAERKDLAAMVNMKEIFDDDLCYYIPDEQLDKNQKVNNSILLVGDSFGEEMVRYLEYYFSNVENIGIFEYQGIYEENLPDIVVWECVERYINRMLEYKLLVD